MKKYVAICATLAALGWVGVAAAIPPQPQGKLTGSATLANTATLAITSPVIDGGTSYVGAENDRSGNCDADSGTVTVNGTTALNVVCAHYVTSSGCCNAGSPKMRFAYLISFNFYGIVRITDNGASTDTVAFSSVIGEANAEACVNRGARGGGCAGWVFYTITSGDYTITASQT
jgi:hypothetical protein